MIKSTTLALAALIAVPITTAPVVASDYWDWSVGSGNPETTRQKAQTQVRQALQQAKRRARPKVMAYVKREGDEKLADRREFSCADKVRGLGTQWIGTEGALDAAKKDWMERVRYDYGKSFLDMNEGQGLRFPLRARVHRRGPWARSCTGAKSSPGRARVL